MRQKSQTESSMSSQQNDRIWLKILAIYQISRGLFGISLLPFPLDFLFRIFLCSTGILVCINKKIGTILLFIVLIVSIPYVAVLSKTTYFYWPPVVLTPPINIGFSLFDFQSGSESEGTRISIHGVYVVLLFTLGKALRRLSSDG